MLAPNSEQACDDLCDIVFIFFLITAPAPAPAPAPQPTSNAGFGPLVSASGASAPQSASGDRYAALSQLDNLFGPATSSSTSIGSGSTFGSGGSSSFGMSSGPNPFSSTSSGAMSGGFQQTKQPQQQQMSNPFQGLGGGTAGFGQLNGPTRSMSPASSMTATSGSGSVFGSQPVSSGFGSQPSSAAFGSSQPSSGGFGNFSSAQPQSSFGGSQQPGWGGMGGMQPMGGQNMGMAPASTQQNLSLGGAGMTAMAWTQFGKMGGGQPQQQPPVRGQMNFGGNQPGFGGNQGFGAAQPASGFGAAQPASGFGAAQPASGFGAAQPASGFGASTGGFGASSGGFGANPMPGGGTFGSQQQASGFGNPGGFGGQLASGGFGSQGGAAFGGSMQGMGGGQFGQQQMQQFGGWQQGQQANPFMVGTCMINYMSSTLCH